MEFTDNENFERDLKQISDFFEVKDIAEGENLPLKQINAELESYFKHPFTSFKTPIQMIGTDFQQIVWQELQNISAGITSSYSEIAEKIDNLTNKVFNVMEIIINSYSAKSDVI